MRLGLGATSNPNDVYCSWLDNVLGTCPTGPSLPNAIVYGTAPPLPAPATVAPPTPAQISAADTGPAADALNAQLAADAQARTNARLQSYFNELPDPTCGVLDFLGIDTQPNCTPWLLYIAIGLGAFVLLKGK